MEPSDMNEYNLMDYKHFDKWNMSKDDILSWTCKKGYLRNYCNKCSKLSYKHYHCSCGWYGNLYERHTHSHVSVKPNIKSKL